MTSQSSCSAKFVKFSSFSFVVFSHRVNKIVLGDGFLCMHCKSIKLISRLHGVINSHRCEKLHYVLKPGDARMAHVDDSEFFLCGSFTKCQVICGLSEINDGHAEFSESFVLTTFLRHFQVLSFLLTQFRLYRQIDFADI